MGDHADDALNEAIDEMEGDFYDRSDGHAHEWEIQHAGDGTAITICSVCGKEKSP